MKSSDAQMLYDHHLRHTHESGRDGDIIFTPQENYELPPFEKWQPDVIEKLERPVTQVKWDRIWLLTDEKSVFGELTLTHRPPLPASLHRATLMMGIERSHRKGGFGKQMMTSALEWAHQQPTLDWLDLNVFEHNLPAQGLYKKFGFVESGKVTDLFRVFNQSVSDLTMVLKLK